MELAQEGEKIADAKIWRLELRFIYGKGAGGVDYENCQKRKS